MKKHYMLLILAVLALIAVVFFTTNTAEAPEETATENATSSTELVEIAPGVEVELPEGATVERLPVEGVQSPDLDRAISTPEYFNAEASRIAAANIADAITRIEEDPTLLHWLQLAILREQIEDYDGAIEIYEYLNVASPENDLSFLNLGNIYALKLQQYELAEESYLQALENNASNPITYLSLHELYRYNYKTDTDRAEEILLEGISFIDNHPNLLLALASYYQDQGRDDEAIEQLQILADTARELGDPALEARAEGLIADIRDN